MKKLKLAVFTLIILLVCGTINVSALVSGDFTYNVNADGETVKITGHISASRDKV